MTVWLCENLQEAFIVLLIFRGTVFCPEICLCTFVTLRISVR